MKKTWVRVTFIVILTIVILLGIVEIFYLNRTYSAAEMRRVAVLVQHRTGYAITANGKDILYFREMSADSVFLHLDSLENNALKSYYSTGVWINEKSYIPSCYGTILAHDFSPDVDSIAKSYSLDVDIILRLNILRLKSDIRGMEDIKSELDYYLSVHDLMDNEFDRVSSFAVENNEKLRAARRYLDVLNNLRASENITIRPISKYNISVNGDSLMQKVNCRVLPFVKEKDEYVSSLQKAHLPKAAIILQTDSMVLPTRSFAVSLPLICDFSYEMSDSVYVLRYKKKKIRLTALKDAFADLPMFTRGGRFNGFTPVTCHHIGEADTLGYKVLGKTDVDSLLKGTFTDSLGTYRGQMTYEGKPTGIGVFKYKDGGYYEGEWHNGKRHGNGFYVKDGEMVKAGEWSENKYRGERMIYNSYRVYGIDISRYQHEIGRRVYGIDWKNLRITHLGDKNSADAADSIDYPVSFVYIKSTQGITIKSRYYSSDAKAARRHGIKCGAYHFFSIKVDALKQARYFLNNTQILESDLPPVLDVEPTNRQIAKYGGEEKLFDAIRVWMTAVEAKTGKRPILYVSQKFIKEHLVKAPDICEKYQVWIARYGAYRPEVKLLFWQLTPYGRVKGIKGYVDINVFNGYAEQFDLFKDSLSVSEE
ncbi:MAG: hypothetical protein K6E54_07540 [Bacteroidaceae bacterium]|nr:hypothetical protein [Bacteroidaceae bacterium]